MDDSLGIFRRLSNESKMVFGLIQKLGPMTKNELLILSQMKLTSLNRVMQPLEELCLVVEAGIGESTGGRKPILYDVNSQRYYLIGIDISRMYTQIVFTNLKMQMIGQRQFSMTDLYTPEKTVKTIHETICDMLSCYSIDRTMLLGIGTGTIGPLDRIRGLILNPQNFFASGWGSSPIKEILERGLSLPVIIDNGANTAVLAELLFGEGRGLKNIAYINCGIGIRTGVVSSGNIVRTINDAEDAFGHMVIDVDGEPCTCGNFGCIECYSSILSITRQFISALKKGRTSNINKSLKEINFIDICRAADEQDDLAKEVIIGAATIFGAGLANYINLLNPRLVVMSGPIIKYSKLFYQICTEAALKRYYLKEESKIIFSRGGYFKDNAISIGAAAMFLENEINPGILG